MANNEGDSNFFWKDSTINGIPLNPRRKRPRTDKPGMIGREYVIPNTTLQNSTIPQTKFKLLELENRESGFSKNFATKIEEADTATTRNINLGNNPILASRRLERISKIYNEKALKLVTDIGAFDPDLALITAYKRIDPEGNFKISTGRMKVIGDPSIRFDKRLIERDSNGNFVFDLNSRILPVDPTIFYAIDVDKWGNKKLVVNNAVMQRFVIDFDGDEVFFREIRGSTSRGKPVKVIRGSKYPLLSNLGKFVEDENYVSGGVLKYATNIKNEHINQMFKTANDLQSELLRLAKPQVTEKEARAILQRSMVPDIIGQVSNRANAQEMVEAERSLQQAINNGESWALAYKTNPALRASYIRNYGLFEGFSKGAGLNGTNEKQLLVEEVIKSVAKRGKTALQENHPLFKVTTGIIDENRLISTSRSSEYSSTAMMADLLQKLGSSKEDYMNALTNLITGRGIDETSYGYVGKVRMHLQDSVKSQAFKKDLSKSPDILKALMELGEIRVQQYQVPGHLLPEEYRSSGRYTVSILEHLTENGYEGFSPIMGGAPSSFKHNNVQTGAALLPVHTYNEEGEHVFRSGLQHLRTYMKKQADIIGFGIKDNISKNGYRLPGMAEGRFEKSRLMSQNGVFDLRQLAASNNIKYEDAASIIANDEDGSELQKLIITHDKKNHNTKIRKAKEAIKEYTEKLGIEVNYRNTGEGIELNNSTQQLLGATVFADSGDLNLPEFISGLNTGTIRKDVMKLRKDSSNKAFLLQTRRDGSLLLGEEGNMMDATRAAQLLTQLGDTVKPKSGLNVAYINIDKNKLLEHFKLIHPGMSEQDLSRMYGHINNMAKGLSEGVAIVTESGAQKVLDQYRDMLVTGDSFFDPITNTPKNPITKLVHPNLKVETLYVEGLQSYLEKDGVSSNIDVILGFDEVIGKGGMVEAFRKRAISSTQKAKTIFGNIMRGDVDSINPFLQEVEDATLHIDGITPFKLSMYSLNDTEYGFSTRSNETGGNINFLEEGVGIHEVQGLPQVQATIRDIVKDIDDTFTTHITNPDQKREVISAIDQLVTHEIASNSEATQHFVNLKQTLEAANQINQAMGITNITNSALDVVVAERRGALEGIMDVLKGFL